MEKVQGFMVEKLSEIEIKKLIAQYISAGWTFQNLTELGQHRLLTFCWPFDSDPPNTE